MLKNRKCRFPANVNPILDERSLKYLVSIDSKAVIKSSKWDSPLMLNQGRSWACTGFSTSMCAASDPTRKTGITKRTAHRLYKMAQRNDEWAGEDYRGSSVIAAVKVACKYGWFGGYQWATTLEMLQLAVGHIGPVILTVPWHSGMNKVDNNGLIRPTGRMTGYHAILCRGYDAGSKAFLLRQSAGKRWGMNGDCWIRETDLWLLLQNRGSACVPIRN